MSEKEQEQEIVTTEEFKMSSLHKLKAKISGIQWGDPVIEFKD